MLKRILLAIPLGALLIALSSGAVAAHGLEVTPAGQDEAVFSDTISTSWAQAHCHALSPEVATASSDGVVAFSPAEALPCPATANPGGQIHPHADSD